MHFNLRNPQTITRDGAPAGCVLCGVGVGNRGVRLRLLERQARGCGGPIRGRFVILDAGDNKHSYSLGALLGKVTDAGEVLRTIRERSPACVSVVNANILAREG
jgi:hypothetical protein